MNLISTAANEYANRPADESFPDLNAMIATAKHEKDLSKEREFNLRDVRATLNADGGLRLQSDKGIAKFTHWAFSQFSRMIGAPAGYLRSLSPILAASCINYGIQEAPTGQRATFLVRAPNGQPEPTIRCVTSDRYTRLWDSDLYSEADRRVFQHATQNGDPWIQPPTWDGGVAGTWRGDRDSFVIRVDGGSIVTDPSLMNQPGKDARLYRGILIRNSEVGASGIVIDWVLYQYICGNLNLWGAVVDRRFRRKHIGQRVLGDTMRELGTLAVEWTQRSASQDEAIIKSLIDRELATTKDGVIDELRAIGYTKEQAESAIVTCEKEFTVSPWSVWGLAQGTTRNSQQETHQDERYTLDQLASKLMATSVRARVAA